MKALLSAAALVLAFATAVVMAPNLQAQSSVRDCDSNAIIYCGALTQAELKQKYSANASNDLPAVFSYYGISAGDIDGTSSEIKMGEVTKDGRVLVDGKVVATGAKSVGRQNMSGSSAVKIGDKTYYERATSISFRSNSLSAIVMMKNGQFHRAILTSCGNPVVAVPVKPVEQPKPQPAYACTKLQAQLIRREGQNATYRFTTTATATNGATIVNYDYGFGDGMGVKGVGSTYEYTYKQPGTYTAEVAVNVRVDNETKRATGDACKVKVTVEEEKKPVEKPEEKPPVEEEKGEVLPAEVPTTGAGQFIGAGMGVSSLTAAGYYFLRSRRDLMSTLLKK